MSRSAVLASVFVLVHHEFEAHERTHALEHWPRRALLRLPGQVDNRQRLVPATEHRVVAAGASSEALNQVDTVQFVAGPNLALCLGE